MNKIAILYLCTGDYVYFWEEFFKSYEKKFLPNSEKHYFVWTDAAEIYEEKNPRVHKKYKEYWGFPEDALKKYHTFKTAIDELVNYDYIFLMNANIICCQTVTEEEFLPPKNALTVVRHIAFYDCLSNNLPYERRPSSTAWIPYDYGDLYVLGGVNGGGAEVYCKMIKELTQRIDADLQRDIVAVWHDESHFNRYIIEKSVPIKVLNPDYGYFEDFSQPFEQKILVLDKRKYIDIDKIKLGLK